jgi:hypothetical protein
MTARSRDNCKKGNPRGKQNRRRAGDAVDLSP